MLHWQYVNSSGVHLQVWRKAGQLGYPLLTPNSINQLPSLARLREMTHEKSSSLESVARLAWSGEEEMRDELGK